MYVDNQAGDGGATQSVTTWVDEGTRYPIRVRTSYSTGDSTDVYFSYDVERTQVSDHASDFFAAQAPTSQESSQSVRYTSPASSSGVRGVQMDQETHSFYTPLVLGAGVSLNSIAYCLTGTTNVVYSETSPDSAITFGDNAPPLPDVLTYSDAFYDVLGSVASCTGLTPSDTPPLVVRTTSSSTYAAALRAEFEATGRAVSLNPLRADFLTAGIIPGFIGVQPVTAYVATTGQDERAAFIDDGITSVVIRGPLARLDLPLLLTQIQGR